MKVNTYDIFLNVDVKRQFIASKVSLSYNIYENQTDELIFYVHKGFKIKSITGDFIRKYEVGNLVEQWSAFILESKYIKIFLEDPISKNKHLTLNFEYEGYLNLVTQYGINRITDYWVELGFYTPWFPLTQGFESSLFNVKVEIDPGYVVIGATKMAGLKNTWFIEYNRPQNDCVILASNQFKIINDEIEVYYLDDNHALLAKMIVNDSKQILSFYEMTFGKHQSSKPAIVILPRNEGGGYCRDGLIVIAGTSDLKANLNTFKFIAHELAHLWWFRADFNTWEDWLNESISEYSALMVVKEKFGEIEFQRLIDLYRSMINNLPPIKNLNRKDNKAYEVLYRKGPFILYKLENKIGKTKFINLLKKSHQQSINKTSEFLDILKADTNEQISDDLCIWLKT